MTTKLHSFFTIGLFTLFALSVLSSCNKDEEELHAFKGIVYNAKNEPVEGARVNIFPTPNDWMTGHNKIKTLITDKYGRFESTATYEGGEYYVFIEKIDSTNWNVKEIDQGIFPKITLPISGGTHSAVIDYTSMSIIANTHWELVNVMREYGKPGQVAKEWQNLWDATNNCRKDNSIIFNNSTKFIKSEGQYVCKDSPEREEVRFTPPLILSNLSCTQLPNTSVLVKEMDYYDWPEFSDRDGHIYMGCERSVGQLYLYYLNADNQRVLEVYQRR